MKSNVEMTSFKNLAKTYSTSIVITQYTTLSSNDSPVISNQKYTTESQHETTFQNVPKIDRTTFVTSQVSSRVNKKLHEITTLPTQSRGKYFLESQGFFPDQKILPNFTVIFHW